MPIESFVSPPLLAAPAWVWATLLMAGFVAVTVLAIALARVAVRERPASARASGDEDGRAGPPGRSSP